MIKKYFVPNEEKQQIINELGFDPFEENIIDTDTIQLYEDLSQSINDVVVDLFGEDLIVRYSEYVNPKTLRIYRKLQEEYNDFFVKNMVDFSILDFQKTAPHYDRGRKTKAEYHDETDDALVIEKIFNDIRENGNGRLTDLEITFNWYCEDGTIGLTKTQIVKKFNKSQAETEERVRRERSIDFLISEARGTENEPYMDLLLSHYEQEISKFKSKGSTDFATNIKNEIDPTINAILSARVPFTSDNNFTLPIKESILYQLGDIDEAQLITFLMPAE